MDTDNLKSGFYYLKRLEESIDSPKGTVTIARYTKYDGEYPKHYPYPDEPWEFVGSDCPCTHTSTLEDFEILGTVPDFVEPNRDT